MKFERAWSWQSVREVCIKCNWYTKGNNEAYHNMLMFVESHRPTDRNIEKVAEDIFRHSERGDRTVRSVAYVLASEAVSIMLVEEN